MVIGFDKFKSNTRSGTLDYTQNRFHNFIQVPDDIFREETEDEIPLLLKGHVFSTIAAVGVSVFKMMIEQSMPPT